MKGRVLFLCIRRRCVEFETVDFFLMSRVAVTGLGCVTCLGSSLEATWHGLKQARKPDQGRAICPDVKSRLRRRKAWKTMDRRAELLSAAALEAVGQAGLEVGVGASELGVSVGVGSSSYEPEELTQAFERGREFEGGLEGHGAVAGTLMRNLNPLWLLKTLPNMAAAHLAIEMGARGPSYTTGCGRLAGGHAILEGAGWIQRGEAEVVIAGAVEAPLFFPVMGNGGDGILAEVSAVLILENEDHARLRGATELAWLSAWREGMAEEETECGEADAVLASETSFLGDVGGAWGALGSVLSVFALGREDGLPWGEGFGRLLNSAECLSRGERSWLSLCFALSDGCRKGAGNEH